MLTHTYTHSSHSGLHRYTLEKGGLRSTLTDAVMAARVKAEQLGKKHHGLPDSMASGMGDDTF